MSADEIRKKVDAFFQMPRNVQLEQARIAKQIALSIEDEPSYQIGKAAMLDAGIHNADLMPANFDAKFVENWRSAILDGEQYFKFRESAH